MAGQKIKVGDGFKLKDGKKLEKAPRRKMSVSAKIAQNKSKRVRVVRRGTM